MCIRKKGDVGCGGEVVSTNQPTYVNGDRGRSALSGY